MLNPDFRDMLSAFIAEDAEFLIVGAYALAAHGVPRATGDLDFWVRRTESNAVRVLRALEAFGAPTQGLGSSDLVTPDLVFQIGVEPSRIDILTSIDGVEFEEAWQERMIARIEGLDVPLLGLRHIISNKRAVGRPRDLADVAALEELQDGREGSR
jgi:hypothetical protein